jgi:hypothetical protein
VIGFGVLGDVAIARTDGGSLGCDLLNLRDFRSEALVLGNCAAVCFDDGAKEGAVVDVDAWVPSVFVREFSFGGLCFWFTAEVPGVPLRRRFFWGRGSFVFSITGDGGGGGAGVGREGGGPLETFWHLSIPKSQKGQGEKSPCQLTGTARGPFNTWSGRRWW